MNNMDILFVTINAAAAANMEITGIQIVDTYKLFPMEESVVHGTDIEILTKDERTINLTVFQQGDNFQYRANNGAWYTLASYALEGWMENN